MATAQQSIPSASVIAKATLLLEQRAKWATVRDARSGMRRVILTSDSGRVYYVDPAGRVCSCPAGRVGMYCSHREAVNTANHRDALAAWLETPPVVEAAPAPAPKKTYGALFPACGVYGCDEDAGRSGYCLEHARCPVCREPSMKGLDYATCEAHEMSDILG